MKTYVVTVTVVFALDALCAHLNDLQGNSTQPWVRPVSRIVSLAFALWGAWIIGGLQ